MVYSKYVVRIFSDVKIKQFLRKPDKEQEQKMLGHPVGGIRKSMRYLSPENTLERERDL